MSQATAIVLSLGVALGAAIASLITFGLTQRARAGRDELTDKLAASQARARALLLSLPDFLMSLDSQLRVREMKPADAGGRVSALLRLEDRTLSDMFPTEIVDEIERAIGRAHESDSTQLFEFPLRVSRDQRWFEARVTPAGDESLLIVRDITERKVVLEGLERAKHSAEAAVQASTGFVAKMTHDLRNPLTSSLMLTQRLLETEEDPKRRRALHLMLDSTQHLAELVNDILDFSRAEAGKMELAPQPLDIRALVADVVELQGASAETQNITLESRIEAAVPSLLMVDAMRLRQILTNLIGNALKFTHEGGVRIELAYRDGDLILVVRDSGVGIPTDTIPQLFDPFVQASAQTTQHYGGTGLGLAVCKQLVDLMEGTIEVHSDVGKGTEVHVRLSLATVESEVVSER